MATDINKNINFTFKSKSELSQTSKQLEEILKLIEQQNIAVKDMGSQYSKQTATMTKYYDQMVTNQQKMTASQAAANKAAEEMNQKLGQQTTELKKVSGVVGDISSQFESFQRTIMAAFTVSALKSFIGDVIEAKSKLDFFKLGLDNIVQSERNVNMVYQDVIRLAKTSPFTVEDLTQVTLKLSAMGVETANLVPTIEALGNAAAVAGNDKLPLIAKAYTDVMNKGKLMKQEINQFSENSIPIYNMLADSMHKTRAEVIELAEAHKISFSDVEKAFKDAGKEGGIFFNMMGTQSKTLGGQISNLHDTVTLAKARFGDFFENTIKRGIMTMSDLVDTIGGSNAAIERSVNVVKSIVTAYATYQTATKGAVLMQEAWTAAMNAGKTIQAAYQTAVLALKGTTEGLTDAQKKNVATMSGAVNPMTAILTVAGLLATAYFAWKAATEEVSAALSDEEIRLKNSQSLMNGQVKSVMALKEGTDERKKALQGLINQYPEYFSGLSKEVTNNATLNAILQRVNTSYEDRIDLARQTYKIDELEKRRGEFLQQELELMERIKKRSPEIYAQVGGDVNKLIQLSRDGNKNLFLELDKSGSIIKNAADNVLNGTIVSAATKIAKGLKDIDEEIQVSATRRTALSQKERESAIAAEEARWKAVASQMKKGTKEYEYEQEQHEKRVRDITGETVRVALDGEDKKQKAKKTTTEMSLENDIKELKSMQQTYAVKMQLINTQEKLDIERAKRMIENTEAENERILSIQREAANKRGALAVEFAQKELASLKAWLDEQVNQHKKKDEKIHALREVAKLDWEKQNEEIKKLDEKLLDIQADQSEKRVKMQMDMYAEMAANEGHFYKTRQELYLEASIEFGEKELANMRDRKAALEQMAEVYRGSALEQEKYKQILIDIAVLTGKITEAEKENFDKHDALIKEKMARVKEYFNVALDAVAQLSQADYEAMMSSWDAATEAVDNFYDYAIEANKKAFEYQLENSKYSLDQMSSMWQSYADRQRLTLESKQSFDIAAANMKNIIENMKEVDANMNKFTELLAEGKYFAAIVNGITNIFQVKKRMAEDEKEMRRLEMEQTIAKYDQEIALVEQLLQVQQKAIQDEYDAKVKAINDEIAATEAKYAALKAQEEQFYSDSQLRLQKDDVYRKELLVAGEAREVAALMNARDRQVKAAQERGATAEEVARIVNAFEQLITDKHKEYQEAQGNVTKETSLANQEVKAQEADAVSEIEWNLQGALDELRTKLYDAQVQMQQAMVVIQHNAALAQIRIEREKWEVMRNFAVSELKVAAATALGKGNAKGHAIAMTQAIELENMPNPFDGIGGAYQIYAPGIPGSSRPSTPARPRENTSAGTPISGGGDSSGGSPRPGRPRYYGTEWLRSEPGEGFTRDGILINANEGERIISYIDNLRLLQQGGKVSNQQLVDGFLQLKEMQKMAPGMFTNNKKFDYKGMSVLKNLPGLVNMDYSKMIISGSQGGMNIDKLATAIDKLASKPSVNVTVSPRKIITEEMRGNHKTIYENTYNKSI